MRALCLLCVLMLIPTPALSQEPAAEPGPPPVRGRIDSVTVYRGQALVTRLIELPAGAGLLEIVVADLPEHVVPGSLYAESAEGVQVRSVSYRARALAEDVRGEVRQLDAQIQAAQDQLAANERTKQVLAEQRAYLERLANFVAPTATAELTQGVLDAETLQKVTTFQFDERVRIAEAELRANVQERELSQQIQLLQRRRAELASSSARTAREALVFINVEDGANGPLRLRYVVNNATWSPSYNIRTEGDRERVSVEYLGSVQQMSGEDWNDVAMTLSTATPSLTAKAPRLEPLTIALAPAGTVAAQAAPAEYEQQRSELSRRKQAVEEQYANRARPTPAPGAAPGGAGDGAPPEEILLLNRIAGELQMLDLQQSDPRLARRSVGRPEPRDEGVSVTYELPARTSLPSRSDRQLIQIAALDLPGEFYKVAVPVLTSFVYDEASVANESPMVLLAGPVSTYLDGQFVGHSEIATVAAGERFTVGFGIDSSLRTDRDLAAKTEAIQGGNKVMTFTYRLRVENFRGEAVPVRVLERLPTAVAAEAKVTLVKATPEPANVEGGAFDARKGLLRWDVEVPAQATGAEALAVEYTFTLEHDRQMAVGVVAVGGDGIPLQMQLRE